MKEEIKQVIKGWYYYDKAFGWAEDEDDFVDSLATRLDKAIGIDEYKLERVLKENVNDITGLEDMHSFRYFGTPMNKIIKSIIKDRPLKCEVEE